MPEERQSARPFGPIIGLIQALVGLEWLLSGISKWRSPNFLNRFPIDVAEKIHQARGTGDWYHDLVDTYLVQQGDLLSTVVIVLEIAIGVILLLGASDWLIGHRIIRRWLHSSLTTIVVTALLLGVFLDYNISLVHGVEYPGFGVQDVFGKAIPFDFFLIFLSLILIAADVIDLRHSKKESGAEEPAEPQKETVVVQPGEESKLASTSPKASKPPEKIPSGLLPREGTKTAQSETPNTPVFPTTDTAPPLITPSIAEQINPGAATTPPATPSPPRLAPAPPGSKIPRVGSAPPPGPATAVPQQKQPPPPGGPPKPLPGA